MNRDEHLLFEAYMKKLNENSLIPSDDELQAAITKRNGDLTVNKVKSVINIAIQHYKPTSEEDLKGGLYEDLQDAANNAPTSGGKPRFDWKQMSIADLAAILTKQLKQNQQIRARNAQGENAEEDNSLKKYTYEILYKTNFKYDPKTKKAVSWEYKSHSSGRPDIRHKFAHTEDEFWNEISNSGLGGKDEGEMRKTIIIKNVEPANLDEVESERGHAETMHDYYHGPGSKNRYFGD